MIAAWLTGCAAALPGWAQEAPKNIEFGGDIRARYEFKDNWPEKGKATASSAYEDYLRFRTRVWGKAKIGDELTTYIRLGNEFRNYRNSDDNSKQEFPDELFLDNLYGEWKNDSFGVKLGRQDITKGAGRVIADGTPGDGSRSTHFDAGVLTLNFAEKSSVDFIGTWNHYRDDLSLGETEGGVYDMTKIKSGDPYSKMDEGGLIAYATINEFETMPFETYWVWKIEEDFRSKDETYPGRDFHTAGIRLTPQLTEWLSAEVEAAYQFGEIDSQGEIYFPGEVDEVTGAPRKQSALKSRDISAAMLYAGLTGKAKDMAWSPSLTLGMLYLSGDEDSYYKTKDGSTDNGWNTVFNRETMIGNIPEGMYDTSRWSNLIYPHVKMDVKPAKGHSVSVETGPMYAAEKDNGATDDYRGLFAKAKYGFPLTTVAGITMNGALVGEVLDYGDYYADAEDAATWFRLEISAKF